MRGIILPLQDHKLDFELFELLVDLPDGAANQALSGVPQPVPGEEEVRVGGFARRKNIHSRDW